MDYLLHQYAASAPAPRYSNSPQDYVPTDSAYIRSTNPRLAATNQYDNTQFLTTQQPSQYASTMRPYPKQIEGYDFYFPQADDFQPTDMSDPRLSYLREMLPPQRSEEPDYYAVLKMKKNAPKKYNSNLKQVNLNGVASPRATVKSISPIPSTVNSDEFDPVAYQPQPPYEDYPLSGQATYRQEHQVSHQQPDERLTPKTAIRTLREEELNTGEYLPSILRNGNGDNQRVEFQMHGFNGPDSYRFGFDTGKG